jgi:hypothetical protein
MYHVECPTHHQSQHRSQTAAIREARRVSRRHVGTGLYTVVVLVEAGGRTVLGESVAGEYTPAYYPTRL